MVSGNQQENENLGREQRRLEIKINIGRPEGFPYTKLYTRRLRPRAVPV